MNLTHPITSVFPGAHGPVLAVLARTYEPMSGRRISALTNGRVGSSRTHQVLAELTEAGVVLCEHRPPAKLYRLNREHVAADGILALTGLWGALLENIRTELQSWRIAPRSAVLFGSAARGDAGPGSDIDILLVLDDVQTSEGSAHAELWLEQTTHLVDRVRAWSGNECEILELTVAELHDAVIRDDRLVRDLSTDGTTLVGEQISTLLQKKRSVR